MERAYAPSPTPTVNGDEANFRKYLDDGGIDLAVDPEKVMSNVEKRKAPEDKRASKDLDDPMNWPLGQRVPAFLALCVTFGSSVYSPGVAEVSEKFNVSLTVSILGLSLYVLGLAFGPMIAAPVSETRGRLAVYRLTIPLAAVFTLGAGLSQNMASLAVCRFFAGFFGSPCLAIGAGTIADIWPPVNRALATSVYLLAPFLGPALGPAVGGFAAQNKGWRWTQWPILMVLGASGLYSLAMKETYMKIILQKRMTAMNGAPPPKTGPSGLTALKFLLTVTLVRPVMIYRKEYEKSLQQGKAGVVAPEHRLYAAMLGSLGPPVGLFWFAWTSRSDVHWISPILASIPFGWGNLMVFVSNIPR
ncbi:MAG: hypothetical protein Q9195_006613 [Heterodermia aff. obscurata]